MLKYYLRVFLVTAFTPSIILPICATGKNEMESNPVTELDHILPPSMINDSEKEKFYVITTIFNPASYQRRYDLYHNFTRHMRETGAQLITIECIFPSLNQHEFQVTDPNNPFHIQLKSESVYWMKENLINIAVSRLPFHAKWVAWLDADIHFHRNNWIEVTIEALKNYSVVQIFETMKTLGPDQEVRSTHHSVGYHIAHKKPMGGGFQSKSYASPGYGYAMAVETFRKINGLPDYAILGGGDMLFRNSVQRIKTYHPWSRPPSSEFKKYTEKNSKMIFNKLGAISKSILGYVPVTISHYYHGDRKDRQYRERWEILREHNFNYKTDVMKSQEGLLILKGRNADTCDTLLCSEKNLQEDIISYFQSRNEDSNSSTN